MSGRIRCCKADYTYTLSATCPVCGKPTAIAHPARFSVEIDTENTGRKQKMIDENRTVFRQRQGITPH